MYESRKRNAISRCGNLNPSLFLYYYIIAVIIITIIKQLGIEILLLLTITRDWFSLCLLFFLFSYARGIARLRKTEMNCR